MAFTVDVFHAVRTPTRQLNIDNTGWVAPSATALKKGTMIEVDALRVIKEVGNADTAGYLGMLLQHIKDLTGGPISGIRDHITTDRSFDDTIAILKGGPGIVIVQGQQNSSDKGAGWIVGSAINAGTPLHLTADGGITDTVADAHQVGVAHKAASAAADKLEFTFDVTLEDA